jgi:tRNA(fMet)-specific endonuclease VapC
MNYAYLLDTNIISDLVKHPRGIIFTKIKAIGEDKICTSIVVACELKFGAKKKKSPQLIQKNDLLIGVQALSLNLIVVTNNTKEFSRIPNLTVENWLN